MEIAMLAETDVADQRADLIIDVALRAELICCSVMKVTDFCMLWRAN